MDILQWLASIMAVGPQGAEQALVDAHASLPEEELAQAFRAACRSRAPAEVFELFNPYFAGKLHLRKKNRDAASAKREAIAEALATDRQTFGHELALGAVDRGPELAKRLDSRWLDLSVRNEHLELVQALAVPGHAGANKLLSRWFGEQLKKSTNPYELVSLLRTMARVRHPAVTDSVIATITKHAKVVHGYVSYVIAPLILELPKDAVPKLEAMLTKLPEKAVDQLLDFVTQLKNCPDRE